MCFYYCYSHECSFLYGKLYLNGGTASGLTCAIFGLIGIVRHEQSCTFLLQLAVLHLIRESVDSLCRDGADTPMPPYIGKAFTRTNFEDLSLFRYMIMVCE